MAHAIFGRVFTIKTLIRIGFTALSLGSIGVAHSQSSSYHAPAQNYYQNGWMADDRK